MTPPDRLQTGFVYLCDRKGPPVCLNYLIYYWKHSRLCGWGVGKSAARNLGTSQQSLFVVVWAWFYRSAAVTTSHIWNWIHQRLQHSCASHLTLQQLQNILNFVSLQGIWKWGYRNWDVQKITLTFAISGFLEDCWNTLIYEKSFGRVSETFGETKRHDHFSKHLLHLETFRGPLSFRYKLLFGN